MSETTTRTTELTSQYGAQVAGDLERNLKEQERLSGEIEALHEKLAALRHDHTVLVNIQQALGIPAAPEASPVEPARSVPAPRKQTAAAPGAAGKVKARKRTGRKTATAAPSPEPAPPTLVDLVREHLAGQDEPRSAAEIAVALGERHPERTVRTTVVRTTLEGLVAKSQAQRTKQGTSVFYTAPDPAAPAAQASPQSA
ncbi:hypothetical protein [Streptomyces griseoruber]|uniref:Regulatory protein n=1 Tax=Streptomyces griseoruber TaxID=1943 RepID=A0A101SM98_9ACTN|nr:hypothetical protein [Streptomyces griseoruber]KUN76459.1 hypothetical protein AQJ64_38590 [Streptomyces griseoruber]